MAVLSEYKLMTCILAMLILFWRTINALISDSIVKITETVADNSILVALVFFLCPTFIETIKFNSLKSETKKFSQRHLWEFFLFAIYLLFKRLGNFDFYSYLGISYVSYSFIGLLFTELGLYCLYRRDFQVLTSLHKGAHSFFIDAPTTDDSYDRKNFLKTLLDKILSTFDNRYFVENPNAFTILLSESFGIGKTSFLFQVKKAIREEEYKNKIIYVVVP